MRVRVLGDIDLIVDHNRDSSFVGPLSENNPKKEIGRISAENQNYIKNEFLLTSIDDRAMESGLESRIFLNIVQMFVPHQPNFISYHVNISEYHS